MKMHIYIAKRRETNHPFLFLMTNLTHYVVYDLIFDVKFVTVILLLCFNYIVKMF